MMKFIRSNWLVIGIILLGLYLRTFNAREMFMYGQDQDLASWVIKDVVVNHHIRLIGQETSSKGVFIGPLFYYALIPFYFLTHWDPAGGLILATLIGVVSIMSVYFVLTRLFSRKVGIIGCFVYSTSFLVVFTDREVVPTNLVMLWSIWFLYTISLILNGRQQLGIALAGLLTGLIWHINLSLAILLPLPILALVISRKKIDLKAVTIGLVTAAIGALPFFLFETRHNFQQTRSIIGALTSDQAYIQGTGRGLAKLDRVMQLVYKNTTNMFYGGVLPVPVRITFMILLILLLIMIYKRIIRPKIGIIWILWIAFFIGFFTINAINVSEYYLNGMNIIWISIFSTFVAWLWSNQRHKRLAIGVLGLFMLINLYRFVTVAINKSGYQERKAIVHFIDEDAKDHGYPCIAVSYITSPGNEFGYRYFYYLEGMHVNQPKSGSPVYTIVYPHSLVGRIDKSFGALGLVLPDYARYNTADTTQSCAGENANLTDPLFGYTQ
jgi:hypothetical protein